MVGGIKSECRARSLRNLHPPRVYHDRQDPVGVLDIVSRTLEVYNQVHTKPIVDAWGRINFEVENQLRKVAGVIEWLASEDLPPATRDKVAAQITHVFARVGGRTARLSTPLIEIRPTTHLGETLDFSRERAEQDIAHGYSDALQVLRNTADLANPPSTLLDQAEYSSLLSRPIW
jgi:hypothetical protein